MNSIQTQPGRGQGLLYNRPGSVFVRTFSQPADQVVVFKQPPKNNVVVKNLLSAAGLTIGGLLLHRLPQHTIPGVRTLLPVDWKVWARVILGIAAVQKVNKAFKWQPPPWLGGIEAVAFITPIAMKFSRKTFKQVAMMAPLVAIVVQVASELNNRITQPLKEQLHIPPFVTRLGISIGLALVGLRFSKWLGISGAAAMTCVRGCSPGSIVCLSELGEMATGMKTWVKSHTGRTTNEERG